jgi:16S rRNA (guanine1516-N2)-methyltransferase
MAYLRIPIRKSHRLLNFAIITSPSDSVRAMALAAEFNLPLVREKSDQYSGYLCVSDAHISCELTGFNQPLIIDFAMGKAKYHTNVSRIQQHPLVKAIGFKRGASIPILDLTAGVGDDAYLLATLGCRVLMIERHPIVALLLQDAMRRLSMTEPDLPLAFKFIDAKDYLLSGINPDIILYDPMFPKTNKSAKVKKSMQFLQAIVTTDQDADALLRQALQVAMKRVVVKRPSIAKPLADIPPHFSVAMKNYRFDVYLTHLSRHSIT